MRRPGLLTGAALLLLGSRSLAQSPARTQATLDLNTATVTYADTVALRTLAVGPSLRFESDRTLVDLSGTYARIGNGAWTVQGQTRGRVLAWETSRLGVEVGGDVGGSVHADGTRTSMVLGQLRVRTMVATRAGAWGGINAGGASTSGWSSVRGVEVGAWTGWRDGAITVTAAPTEVAKDIRYTDLDAIAAFSRSAVDASVSVGTRIGTQLPVSGDDKAWGAATATWWLASRVGLSLAAGSYPVDYTQGFPGGRYASLGVRLRAAPASGIRAIASAARGDFTEGPSLRVRTLGDGRREIRLRADDAQKVDLSGDFNLWDVVPMERGADGWWKTTVAVAPGAYEVSVRVNGGRWRVPGGLPVMFDEVGGASGILIIR